MIPRILVPSNARPPVPDPADEAIARRPSSMDERTLVPSSLPVVRLDGKSNIPASLPLDTIAARTVVPRDLKFESIAVERDAASTPAIPSSMDERVAVPVNAAPPEMIAPSHHIPLDLVQADVFNTGDVHFLASAQQVKAAREALITNISSVALHILLILAIIFQGKLFPPRQQDQAELARRQMTLLLPPGGLLNPLKTPSHPPLQPSERIRVDPHTLRKVAPPIEPLPSAPAPVIKELPNAPVAKPNVAPPVSLPEAPARHPLRLETPDEQPKPNGLVLPKLSPGRAIEDSVRDASKGAGSRPIFGGGDLPSGSGRPSPGGGGTGGTSAYGGLEMLTPTEGVDFNSYLARVYASVKRNWYAVMPQSVWLGDRGIVSLQFKIMRNGGVPDGEPVLVRTSRKEPLDRAAVSSIRTSNPFEPLPGAFSGPYIELRFTYFYNIPIDAVQQQ
jgi:hypothetical protein